MERRFWLMSITNVINAAVASEQRGLYDVVARRIETRYRACYSEQLEAIGPIAATLLDLT